MIKSDAWAMGIQVDSATGTGMVAMAVLQGRGGWMRKRASLQQKLWKWNKTNFQ